MAAGMVGGGSIVALLTVVAVAAAALVPGVSCRPVAAAPSGGEAERCVHRCATGMLTCAAASGCASVRATTGASWRGEEGSGGVAACGRWCENEYLGCIDVG